MRSGGRPVAVAGSRRARIHPDAARRVGVFGGTFDPPHLGHATAAGEVADALALDLVLWVPAATPPHKDGDIAPGALRRLLVEAAVAHDPRFELCDLELERGGVSYTVDTLRRLRADHPRWRMSLLLGSDLVGDFRRWKEPDAILRLAEPVAIARPGADPRSHVPRGAAARFRTVAVTPIDVSSSKVRERLRTGLSVRNMVSPPVMAIIEREGLYRG